MENKSYEERISELGLMKIEQRHMRQDLITFYNLTQGKIKINLDEFVEILSNSKTRGNSKRIRPSTVRLEIRRNSYFSRVWKLWNRLPENVVTAPTLNTFRTGDP